jgi:TolB protein
VEATAEVETQDLLADEESSEPESEAESELDEEREAAAAAPEPAAVAALPGVLPVLFEAEEPLPAPIFRHRAPVAAQPALAAAEPQDEEIGVPSGKSFKRGGRRLFPGRSRPAAPGPEVAAALRQRDTRKGSLQLFGVTLGREQVPYLIVLLVAVALLVMFFVLAGNHRTSSSLTTQQGPYSSPLSPTGSSANSFPLSSVLGLPLSDARARLEAKGLKVTVQQQPSPQPLGIVLGQLPVAGTSVLKGRQVTLIVSKGQSKPVKVPNVVGQGAHSATAALGKAGFDVRSRSHSSLRPVGTVIAQSPAAGKKLKQGRTVTLTVAAVAPDTKVPNVIGKTQPQARVLLAKAGLVAKFSLRYSTTKDGLVIIEQPAVGATLKQGSRVTVIVSFGSAPKPAAVFAPKGTPLTGNGLLAFVAQSPGGYGSIFTVSANGKGLKRVSSASFPEGYPQWSPNGQQLLFQATVNQNTDIYVVSADGTGLHRLTLAPSSEYHACWAPSGTKFVFVSDRSGKKGIYAVDLDGKDVQPLFVSKQFDVDYPAFSPDGKRVVFQSNATGDWNIYSLPINSGAATRLTAGKTQETNPSFSPDGKQIVYSSDATGHWQIYRMNADGSGSRQLTHDSGDDHYPRFSPDGKQIVFQSSRAGKEGIYLISQGGGAERKVVVKPGTIAPSWQSVQ